jgi:hypothetical protein
MNQELAGRIAGTALQLKDQLTRLGTDDELAGDWVMHAMPAIIAFEAAAAAENRHAPGPGNASDPIPSGDPVRDLYLGGPQASTLRRHLFRAQSAGRLGNVTSLDGIRHDVIDQLAAGPEQDGTDMRLVVLPAGVTAQSPEREAFGWVRANVPGTGQFLRARLAGRSPDGRPVYLVTYQWGRQDQDAPAGASGELPS